MRDDISRRTGLQRPQRGYVEGFFFFFNPAANILLLAVESTAVPGSGRRNVLFTPLGMCQCGLLRLCCRLGLGLFRLRRLARLRLIFI